MPAKSKSQQRFFGVVKGIQKGTGKGSGKAKTAARDMSSSDVDDFAATKHKGLPKKVKKEDLQRLISKYGAKKVKETIMAVSPKSDKGYREPKNPDFEYDVDEGFGGELKGKYKDEFEKARKENAEVLGYEATGTSDTKKQTLKMAHQLKEDAKRDYKAEYKKFQSSTKSKKYRAELNQYNRKKGTYGNGDGKDASHKGGKIAGFEKESTNRGRAEKSRLKKEIVVNEVPISSPSQQPFSSPEARQMVEKDIIKMSKILGKASQLSIKTMMDGVKGKKYDAFDIQRAIMSGNIRDTHTGERDFLRVLWNKVRDGFRRYSKQGKLR